MPLVSEEVRGQIADMWQDLDRPVTFHFYPRAGSPASEAMGELLGELATIHPKVKVTTHEEALAAIPPEEPGDLESAVTTLGVDDQPTGIRYLGFPGGHEFGAFIETIRELSTGQMPQLDPATKTLLSELKSPLHLQVFVTPT